MLIAPKKNQNLPFLFPPFSNPPPPPKCERTISTLPHGGKSLVENVYARMMDDAPKEGTIFFWIMYINLKIVKFVM